MSSLSRISGRRNREKNENSFTKRSPDGRRTNFLQGNLSLQVLERHYAQLSALNFDNHLFLRPQTDIALPSLICIVIKIRRFGSDQMMTKVLRAGTLAALFARCFFSAWIKVELIIAFSTFCPLLQGPELHDDISMEMNELRQRASKKVEHKSIFIQKQDRKRNFLEVVHTDTVLYLKFPTREQTTMRTPSK